MSLHEGLSDSISIAIHRKGVALISTVLTKKFEKKGIKVGQRKLKSLATEFIEGAESVRWKNIEFELTDSELRRIEAQFTRWSNKLDRKIKQVYNESAEEATDRIIKTLDRTQKAHLEAVAHDRERFDKELYLIWKKPLDLYEAFLAVVEEMSLESHNNAIDKNEVDDVVFETLFRLVGRGVVIGKEILILMKSGFADGAHARWRSLFEIAVIAMFIEKHGKDVAERYLAHDAIEFYKGAELHQKDARAMKWRVVPKRDMARYKRKRDAAVTKYGGYFHKGDYGWASAALANKKQVTFADLEADIGQGKWRRLYKQASWNVHATSSGITSRMGLMDGHQHLILFGGSYYGLTDAAHGATIALMYLASTIINREASLDGHIRLMTLIKLNDRIGKEFLAVQDSFEGALEVDLDELEAAHEV